mgnify:CR=1 FL=1
MTDFLAACVVAGTPLVFATLGELLRASEAERAAEAAAKAAEPPHVEQPPLL